ncbi:MFS transporter [Micromonospora siamensis]|uniref:MFS transporter n=1 Tax=Micromonospora siamensis TaxID=299152 RepID=UPI0012FD1152
MTRPQQIGTSPPPTQPTRPARRDRLARRPSLAALVLLTGIGPFATDTYIAALPELRRSLHTSATVAQLTMTAFIVGVAAGQLLLGPVSDSQGRRRIVIASSVTFAVLSAVCAVAPAARSWSPRGSGRASPPAVGWPSAGRW